MPTNDNFWAGHGRDGSTYVGQWGVFACRCSGRMEDVNMKSPTLVAVPDFSDPAPEDSRTYFWDFHWWGERLPPDELRSLCAHAATLLPDASQAPAETPELMSGTDACAFLSSHLGRDIGPKLLLSWVRKGVAKPDAIAGTPNRPLFLWSKDNLRGITPPSGPGRPPKAGP